VLGSWSADERHPGFLCFIASEGAFMGAIHHQAYCPIPVIVSDDAGSVSRRRGTHCAGYMPNVSSIKLVPPTTRAQRHEIAKRMIWWFLSRR